MTPIVLVFLLLLVPPPAAQDGLAARNRAFLRAVERSPRDTVASFFPRRGDWAWIQTTMYAPSPRPPSVQRFAASETLRAISAGGPACYPFWQPGGMGPVETALSMQVIEHGTRWRRVAGDRFVPPGRSARSPVFVQWRRKDGRWVVSSFGDGTIWVPDLIGEFRAPSPADTTHLPATPAYAAEESWYVHGRQVTFAGWLYDKRGEPAPVADSLLELAGRVGPVAVYAEKGHTWQPAFIYVPVAPGVFQRYGEAESRHAECS
jgi:hypothetical protein